MEIYIEKYENCYVEIDTTIYSSVKYPIKYCVFDIIREHVPEIYSEISSWEAGGYVSNYQLEVL